MIATLRLGLVFLFLVLFGGSVARGEDSETRKQFFENLTKLCGQSLEGVTEFPQTADHPMVGKKLIMSVATCSDREIRIPLQVGDDKSRTWVLTLSEQGLLLKHDHRHLDGTPDKQTNYGGWAKAGGTAEEQSFAADAETAKLIPEAATNVWMLRIDREKLQFTYALQRDNAPRYKAVFELHRGEKKDSAEIRENTGLNALSAPNANHSAPRRC